jgi:hypothetical protein
LAAIGPRAALADDERAIRSLASDLPSVWHAAMTTAAERKKIARLFIEHVSVSVDKASERVDVEIRWAGGLAQSHKLSRPVARYEQRSDYQKLVTGLRGLCDERLSSAAIAECRGLHAAEEGGPLLHLDGVSPEIAT